MRAFYHRRSPRLFRYDYSTPGGYFVTAVTHSRRCLFGSTQPPLNLTDAGRMIERVWQTLPSRFEGLSLDEFIVMPNHLHGILFIAGPFAGVTALQAVMRVFKSQTVVEYSDGVGQYGWPLYEGKLWQRSYHERVIRNADHLDRVREYIVNNPLAWELDRENPLRKDKGRAQGPPLHHP
jgi:putative transposase